MNEHISDEQLIERVTAAMNAEADAAFPEDRLDRQRSRILHRIEHDGRPGRVIAFPAGQHAAPASLMRAGSTTRWVAAAAVVAFIAGLAAGQRLPHEFGFLSEHQVATARSAPRADTAATTLRASTPLTLSDDEFLGEIELAAESRPAVLRHLDALTPRAWDIEVGR